MHLSFISMRATVTKFEEKLFEQDVVVMETYNRHRHRYQISPPCVLHIPPVVTVAMYLASP